MGSRERERRPFPLRTLRLATKTLLFGSFRIEAQLGSSDWGGSMSLIAVTACGDVPVPSGV